MLLAREDRTRVGISQTRANLTSPDSGAGVDLPCGIEEVQVRQGQQNKRTRNRGRKNPNPLTRSYESNGGDVKIDYRPVHMYTLSDDIEVIPPKARVY